MNNKLSNVEWMEYFLEKYNLEKIQNIKKKAAKVEDIFNLMQFSEDLRERNYITWKDVENMRPIVGQIMKNINDISKIYKFGVRGHNVQIEANALKKDINNIDELKKAARDAFIVLQNIHVAEGSSIDMVKRGIVHIMSMLQALMSVNFTSEQIDIFNKIASGQFQSEISYAEEVNASRMESFLKGSIYSSKNSSELTKKVIREVLQNAVDATIKAE
jgi:hypothetical protein